MPNLLSAFGRLGSWLGKQPSTQESNGEPSQAEKADRARQIKAYLDVGRTSAQNAEHWSLATPGDAQVAFNYGMRRTSRTRARMEAANSPQLSGMIETKTNDLVGTGPTLQMLTSNGLEIETAWRSWSTEISLTAKLMDIWREGKMVDGEGLGLMFENPAIQHLVQLDIMHFESEQLGNPFASQDDDETYDGVRHVSSVPVQYYIYDVHPETHHRFNPQPFVGRWYPAERVIHIFRKRRAGQLRGITELGAALPFAAILRRYTLATLGAAELAAEQSVSLETDAPAEDGSENLNDYGIDYMDYVPWVRNMLFTSPAGWHVKYHKPEQPTDTYMEFARAITVQMGFSIGLPAALSHGDSSDYNMASGRLDVQSYIRNIESERASIFEPQQMEKIFLMWMRLWLATKSGISPQDIDPQFIRTEYPHRWTYRPINHSDPEKQAKADVALYQAGHRTIFDNLYSQNKDPELHFRELKRQNELLTELGIPIPGQQPGMPGSPPAGRTQGNENGQQQDSETQEAASA